LALADAGIELFDMVAACTSAQIEGDLILDPSKAEREAAQSSVLIAYMPSLCQITHVVQSGAASDDHVEKMIELCTDGCSKLHLIMKDCLCTKAASKKHLANSKRSLAS